MEIFSVFSQNVITPPILFFILGVIAGLVKSDLDIPKSISHYFAIYLIIAIGFKGGAVMSSVDYSNSSVVYAIIIGIAFSFIQPFIGYKILRKTTSLNKPTAAAVAAHYGSISIVTFVTASNFLKLHNIEYAGFIVAVLALMEAPAIFTALFIAKREDSSKSLLKFKLETMTNASIFLLLGTFAIGWITGQQGMDLMEGLIITPFQGFLSMFLLDMGLLVTKEFSHLARINVRLFAFAILMPLLSGVIGALLSKLIGLDKGTAVLFSTLFASSSYIAVPAAMRMALPDAKASIYLPMSLGITFPFNILLGIPIYFYIVDLLI